MALRNPTLYALWILGIVITQVALSYWSVKSFWDEEWGKGVIFFLGVVSLGMLLIYSLAWLRKAKGPKR